MLNTPGLLAKLDVDVPVSFVTLHVVQDLSGFGSLSVHGNEAPSSQ